MSLKKRGAALLLLLALLTASLPARAEGISPMSIPGGQTGALKITGLNEAGLKLTGYQIMTADFLYDAQTLKGYLWAAGLADWLNANGYAAYTDADGRVTEAFTAESAARLEAFYADLSAGLQSEALAVPSVGPEAFVFHNGDHYDAANQPMGQYLLLVSGGVHVYRPVVATIAPVWDEGSGGYVIRDGLAEAKASLPKVVKTADGQDSAAAGAPELGGKPVRFDIRAEIPQYPAAAVDTTFSLRDEMDKGLAYAAGSLRVYGVDGEGKETLLSDDSYALTGPETAQGADASVFSIAFSYPKIKDYAQVHVAYEATVGDQALPASPNLNAATLQYSNNPYTQGQYRTLESKAKVFTYGLKLNKRDGSDGAPLSGAVFDLYAYTGGGVASEAPLGDFERIAADLTTDEEGRILVAPLNLGAYRLIEKTAPQGYNRLESAINLRVAGETDAAGSLTGLVSGGSDAGWTDGYYEVTVANYKGTVLPSTGGRGTAVFTVAGISLIVLCAVLLLRRRRGE